MFTPRDFLYLITAKRRDFFSELLHEEEITQMEVEILLFLHRNPSENTLTEIILAKDFTKSHASTAISNLLKKGYLEKRLSPMNKKVQKLILLPESDKILEKILICVEKFHEKSLAGISEEELTQMNKILNKICNNLKESD